MSFQGKYQILQTLRDGEVRCFRAQEIASGRSVLVHQLWPERNPPHQPDLATLLVEFLRTAPVEISGHILEIGEESNRGFVVTEDLPECLDLRSWFQLATGAQGKPVESGRNQTYVEPSFPSTIPSEATYGKSADKPGEFTVWFQKAPPGTKPPASPLNDVDTTPPIPISPVAPVAPQTGKPPGEFTMMFRAGSSAPEQPPSPVSPAVPSAPHRDEPAPGSFTGMFLAGGTAPLQPPAPVSAVAPAAPHTDEPPPGSFTGMFHAGGTAPQPPSFPISPGASHSGEFAGMFHGEGVTPQPPPTPLSPPRPVENLASAPKPRPAIVRGQPPSGFEVVYRSRKARPTVEPPSEPAGTMAAPTPDMLDDSAPTVLAAPAPDMVSAPTPDKSKSGVGEFTMMFARAGQGNEPGVASGKPVPLGAAPYADIRMETEATLASPEAALPSPPPHSSGGPGDTGVFERLFSNREGTESPSYVPKSLVEGRETPSIASPDPSRGQGEFTRLFSTQHEPSANPGSPDAMLGSAGSRLPAPPPPAAITPKGPLGNSAEGENRGSFTQFFQRGGELGMPAPPAIPPSPPPPFASGPSRSAQKEPGAVTQILQGYKPPRPDSTDHVVPVASAPVEPAVEPNKGGSGDMTATFQNLFPPVAPASPTSVSPPFAETAPPPPKPAEPGAYTLIMQSPRRSAAAPPAGGPAAGSPGGTPPPAFPMAAPPMPAVPPPGFPAAAPPMPMAPPVPRGQAPPPYPPAYQMPPAQYQQPPPPASPMAAAPGMPFPQPMSAPPPAMPKVSPPAASQKRVILVSLIILGCLLVTALGVVIYFAIKH